MRLGFFVIIAFNLSLSGFCQELESRMPASIPKLTHYSHTDFKTDSQFWDMTVDDKGVRFFGNNDGIVIYDGERWQTLSLPNSSSVRSLSTSSSGRIYAGGFNELGSLEQTPDGSYKYHSLMDTLDLRTKSLENFWQTHSIGDYMVFRAFSALVVLKNYTATYINSNSRFTHSDVVYDHLLVQESDRGVMQLDPQVGELKLLFKNAQFNHEKLVSFLPLGDNKTVLLITQSGLVYRGNMLTGSLELWKSVFVSGQEDIIITAFLQNKQVLLGTLRSGIIVLDQEGEIQKNTAALSKLGGNTILDLYGNEDEVWALGNNGLDLIAYDAPVSRLFDKASVYDILLNKDTLYLATNKGVYFQPQFYDRHKKGFKLISGLEGQAWSIKQVENDLIVGHDRGLFLVKNNKPVRLGTEHGFWGVVSIPDLPQSYLATNYDGLYLLKKLGDTWQLSTKIEGFNESSRDIGKAAQPNTFWVCHGYKGVYKLRFSKNYERVYAIDHFTDKNGFKSPFNINVRHWKDTTIFTSNTGIYTYNYTSNFFEPYAPLNKVLDSSSNTRTILQKKSRTWLVQDDAVAYFDNDKMLHKNLFLNLKGNLNKGMESFLPLDKEQVLIGAKTGLFLYNTSSRQDTVPTTIASVSLQEGEKQRKLNTNTSQEQEIANNNSLLHLAFATPEMNAAVPVQYSYKMEGLTNSWSPWSTKAEKEYTLLPPGEYTFRVKSRNLSGVQGRAVNLSFSVPALWYETTWAISSYLFLFLVLILLTYILVKRKIKLEQRKAQVANYKTKKLLELEIEQLKLKQDKQRITKDKQLLEADNMKKSKELANYTMLLVKKKDIFADTYANLKEFKKTLNTQIARKRLNDVLLKLKQHRIGEEYMNVFDVHFEKVHHNFFNELKKQHSNLSKRELRICAFVKMNLSNKEIAPLLNISVRGVETARYRIRKKLNIQDTSFQEYLQQFSLSSNPD